MLANRLQNPQTVLVAVILPPQGQVDDCQPVGVSADAGRGGGEAVGQIDVHSFVGQDLNQYLLPRGIILDDQRSQRLRGRMRNHHGLTLTLQQPTAAAG